MTKLHKHCVIKTRPGKEQGKDKSLQLAKMCITCVTESPEPQWTSPAHTRAGVSCCHAVWKPCWWEVWKHGQLSGRPVSTLGHLDGGLLVDTEQGDIGHTDEGPFLIGPEHDDRSSLRSLSRHIKVGKANATQIGGKANQDVPVKEQFEWATLFETRFAKYIWVFSGASEQDEQCLRNKYPLHKVIYVSKVSFYIYNKKKGYCRPEQWEYYLFFSTQLHLFGVSLLILASFCWSSESRSLFLNVFR